MAVAGVANAIFRRVPARLAAIYDAHLKSISSKSASATTPDKAPTLRE